MRKIVKTIRRGNAGYKRIYARKLAYRKMKRKKMKKWNRVPILGRIKYEK